MIKKYDIQNNDVPPNEETYFDRLLQSEWRDRMCKGLFRYYFDKPEAEKGLMDGKYGFLAHFHFGKVNESEILFEIKEKNEKDPRRHSILINASPFETFHSLLVPDIQSQTPQKLSQKAIELALCIIFQSGSRSLRLAFNSLCAYASVNHCHWHIHYLSRILYIQTCPLIPLFDSFLWEFEDYSAPGFVFVVPHEKELVPMSRKIHALTSFLSENSIAHNVIMVRGENNEVRIIVWARNSIFGNKDPGAFEMEIIDAHKEATNPYFENVKAQLNNIPF
ncbi:VTC2 [Lepeophtheirus salmonis]|uniref:VTC2 n=1 Tax=Lepeophtheirus salmonis TaxID=72036 RepID=A0A7R8H2S1_LEPSM|nr:VTC2 [Lepeophtheirus salmonis]CAF2833112.1 VTC2 [Lepeophtheirus salmonis]